jgi:hypothetical protein
VSSLAEPLAATFERANAEVMLFVERLSEAEWRAWCEREGRAVGVVVYHIAAGHLIIGEQIEALAQGLPPPTHGITTAEDAARFNALQAEEHASCTRAEVLALLQRNGAQVAALLRALSDQQLAQTTVVRERTMTLQERIERSLLGHLHSHLAAVRETLSG